MILIDSLLIAISIFIFLILVFPFLLNFVRIFTRKRPILVPSKNKKNFACIITAYKDLDFSKGLIEDLQNQDFERFSIYLVADRCTPDKTLFNEDRLFTFYPDKPIDSKTGSLKLACEQLSAEHDTILVFDPDNRVSTDYLSKLNDFMGLGYLAVQSKRTALNLNTVYACLDSAGEIYKNFVERYLPFQLGSSATIAGSGMAIDRELFREYLDLEELKNQNKVILGEDKVLQNFLLMKNHVIAFADKIIVLDAKITASEQVKRQRARWIGAYFENLKIALLIALKGVVRWNRNQFIIAICAIIPPLFLMVMASVFIALALLPIKPLLSALLFVGLLLFGMNFLYSLIYEKADNRIWRALWKLPLFLYQQMKSLFLLKIVKKDFLTTEHQKTS